jgi:hypothetical protein
MMHYIPIVYGVLDCSIANEVLYCPRKHLQKMFLFYDLALLLTILKEGWEEGN